jgi:hypothetical protein
MPGSLRAQQYLDKAKHLRELARTFKSENLRDDMEVLALQYEEMAIYVELIERCSRHNNR